MVAELEQRALEIQAERERVAAERRAKKAAVEAPVLATVKRGDVEVIVRRSTR
jgi:hypothetical protein